MKEVSVDNSFLNVNEDNELIITYGEFSIKNWINLLLSNRLYLPKYQRKFVWEPYRVIELYKSIKENSFIPPVLIAHRTAKNDKVGDYILDGQQRLTALLLLYLGIYPNYVGSDENKGILEQEDMPFDIDWTINKLFRKEIDYNLKEAKVYEIFNSDISEEEKRKQLCATNLYIALNEKELYDVWYNKNKELINNFDLKALWEKCSIGFCYIRFRNPKSKFENKGYANIFKNINSNGVPLDDLESRRALFWSCDDDKGFNIFFEPEEFKNVRVDNKRIDMVSLLAYVAERANGEIKFAVNRRNDASRQAYYNEYVESVIFDENSYVFGKFSEIVLDKEKAMQKVVRFYKEYISKVVDDKFENIMHVQIIMFGLLYWMIYKGKDIRWNDKILDAVNNYKANNKDYTKYRNITKFRERMARSIEIYENCLVD